MHLVALRSSIRVATLAAIAILAGCDLWISNDDLCGEGVVRTHYYLDADDDGYGDPSVDGGCAPQDRYVPDARDCDDADATRSPGTAQYPDGDGDGFGVSEGATSGCDLLDGYSFTAGDCDDAAATIGAATLWYRDADGDGEGAGDPLSPTCNAPQGYVASDSDCDDGDRDRNALSIWFRDADNDGYGVLADTAEGCDAPEGYGAFEGGDCDDLNERFSQQCPNVAVSGGVTHSCALRSDGSAYCWGIGEFHQDEPPDGATFTQLAAGFRHSCGLADGTATCWGDTTDGATDAPTALLSSIATSINTTCGLGELDSVPLCWGLHGDELTAAPPPNQASIDKGFDKGIANGVADAVLLGIVRTLSDATGPNPPPLGKLVEYANPDEELGGVESELTAEMVTTAVLILTPLGKAGLAEAGVNLIDDAGGLLARMFKKTACFPEGTPVMGELGPVAIEDIEPGDRVWSYDAAGRLALFEVVEVYVRQAETWEVVYATGDGQLRRLETTADHPFWRTSAGGESAFVAADMLRWGDELRTVEGPARVLRARPTGRERVVYNFQVEDAHSYLVGDDAVWVHNATPACASEGAAKAATELTTSQLKGIRSLEKQITAHQAKLDAFKANPTVRPGMEGLPQEVIEAQQAARIEHLETEIQTFQKNIEKIRAGGL